ncbi:MAG: diguanylate cyclase [Piscirickettsiaceae bacterium]|nr:diguanylate cyclase [Piscirickettsiaceae bacterium]
MFYRKFLITLATIVLALFSIISHATATLEKVSLQLDWKYQFEFAGFIMAKEKGFYEDEGLDVEILEYIEDIDIVDSVLSGQHNYGIHNSSIVIHEGQLKPAILMATYFQRSPLVLVTSKEIKQPKDLIGKKIMGTIDELKYSSVALMLNHFFVNDTNSTFQPHSFNIDDFAQHKVDAMTAFRTNELFELNKQNIEYNILDPADYGFSMSAVDLFTSLSEALSHPNRTRKFVKASNKGWAYALSHPEETITLIYNHYSNKKSIESLRFEAEITKKMMLLDFFEIGESNKELSLRVLKQLQHTGLLPTTVKLGDFRLEDVLNKFNRDINFTDKQWQYLYNKKEITMCIDPDWMPFESIENGRHIGITADIIKDFNQQLPIPIRMIETKDWQESLSKAKQRQCDIFSLAAKTPERSQYMDFTAPYLDIPIVMATRMDTIFINDIAEIKDKKLGVVKGYAIAETLRVKIPGINIIDVESLSDGLARVENGELFGYIDNLLVISNSIQKDFISILKISSRLDDHVELAIGTRNDQPQLNQVFEILVKNISDAKLQPIYNKWVAVQPKASLDYKLLWKLLIALLLVSLGYFLHIFKLKNLNAQLLTLSTTDKLTGLYNRVRIDELLIQKKADVDRYGIEVALILLDIDLFKNVNDDYGHLTGDAVLIEFAQILKHYVRETDYVGRWGGEEFIIICPNIGIKDASLLADKLLQQIQTHSFSIIGSLTASTGLSQMTTELSINDALSNADKALYQSKKNGRNQTTVYR